MADNEIMAQYPSFKLYKIPYEIVLTDAFVRKLMQVAVVKILGVFLKSRTVAQELAQTLILKIKKG